MFIKDFFKTISVVVSFFLVFILGAIKSVIFGPVAALIFIVGSVGVIFGFLPAHIVWTIHAIVKTTRFDAPLKVAILICLPALFAIWLGLSIAGSVLVGIGYGFFTPWVSSFEAFRYDGVSERFYHCLVDGTWTAIKGSCTVVQDFKDVCYHSYRRILNELRESPGSDGPRPLRFVHVPGCIIAGLMGLIVEIPLYTAIAIVKSPFMLFKGWQRLIHDMISREGPFMESACIPVAGLSIMLWPLIVVGSVILSIFSSFFIGLYASFVVYQERSFRRGVAFVIAMVAAFDEPRYRKKKPSESSELPIVQNQSVRGKFTSALAEAPGIIMPNLTSSRSVRQAIHEVKMFQMWEHTMRSCEIKGKELIDANVITQADLRNWLKGKDTSESSIVDVGVQSYALLHTYINSIKAGSDGLLLLDGTEVTYLNRPQDRLMDWFFQPVMVLKEQLKIIQLEENEVRFLEKVVVLGNHAARMMAWENQCSHPQDPVRAAQIEGISRRMTGIMRSISMLPTFRRRYRHIVKGFLVYSGGMDESSRGFSGTLPKDESTRSGTSNTVSSTEIV
ncbi:hypothetical protein Leryth_017969 [Lithospermum erythrorhizon]|nr:hypothetical protein Leryth_017969 [Lithospermum erythrorhizon]